MISSDTPRSHAWRALLLASLLPFGASAQVVTSSTAKTTAEAEGDVVELSPFEVTTRNDDGYIARNTLSASGMNVPLKDLPQSIEIVTSEMISDLGATRLDEVLRFSAAYNPEQHDAGGIADVNIRGFANTFTLRDGFRVHSGNSDTFNMDRVEIVKGAAAVLYGISEPGGMVNYIVKKPLQRDFTKLAFTGGNYDFKRGTLDFNKNWGNSDKGLSFRLLAVRQRSGTPVPWAANDQDFVAPKLSWRPFRNARIDVSYEYSKRHGFFAGRMPTIVTNTTQPNGSVVQHQYLLPADTFDFGWDFQGPSTFNDFTTRTLTAGIEVRVHPTTVVRANLQQNVSFSDSFQAGGTLAVTTGGNFSRYPGGVDPAPGALREIEGAYNHNINKYRYLDYRIEALTQLTSALGKHDIFYGWEQNQQNQLFNAVIQPTSARVARSTRPVFIDWLRYVTLEQLQDILTLDVTPSTPTTPLGMVARTGGAYVMTRHRLFQDKLLVSLGARFDEDNQGSKLFGIDNLNYVGQYGVVYRITPDVSAFGMYNESFIPQTPTSHAGVLLPTLDGSFDIPPATGLTREAGFKADIGRMTFSVSAFDVRSGGKVVKLYKDPVKGGIQPEDFYTGLSGFNRSTGFETSVAATIFKGYQITCSYVQQHARVVEDAAFPQNNGKPLRSSPVHGLALQNRYEFSSGLMRGTGLGFGFRYSSEAQMELPDSSGITDTKIRPSYIDWNGFCSYRTKLFEKDVSLNLAVTNLFNQKFWLERNRLGDPRMWRLSLKTEF